MSRTMALRGLVLAALLGMTMGVSGISARTQQVSETSCPGPCDPCPNPCGSCQMDAGASCPLSQTAADAAS